MTGEFNANIKQCKYIIILFHEEIYLELTSIKRRIF